MLTKMRSAFLPSVGGPMLVDPLGVPRYWVTVWASFLPGDLAPSTLNKKLRQVELLYHKSTALLVQEQVMNYRGKPDHSFLISSKNRRPLSTEGFPRYFRSSPLPCPKTCGNSS